MLNPSKKDYYADLGKWIIEEVADIAIECREEGIRPCIHIQPRKLDAEQYFKLDKVDMTVDMERLIQDVQAGNSTTSGSAD
jgi:hypothetical protein